MTIRCTECRADREAVKVKRVGGKLAGWWNRCSACSTMFPALPPRAETVRQRRRMYVKRSGQRELFEGR